MTWLDHIAVYRPYFELLNVVASSLAIVTWLVGIPLLFLAWRRSRTIRIRLFGLEASFEQGIAAAAAIGAATAQRSGSTETTPVKASALARTLERVTTSDRAHRISGRSVLWVDDRPSNNRYEKQALVALGIVVRDALDTQPALERLAQERFDLIISDMTRPSGDRAGYDLLSALRTGGDATPVLFYSSSNTLDQQREAKLKGAQGSSNIPQELLLNVIDILTAGNPKS